MKHQQAYFDPNAAQAKQHKLIRVVIILVVIGVVGGILMAILGTGPKNSALGGVLANQKELIRVIDDHSKDLKTPGAANFAVTTRNVLVSGSQELEKVGAKATAASSIVSADTQLATASQNNRLDEALTEMITTTLEQDLSALSTSLAQASERQKTVIESLATSYSLLIGED